MRETSFVLTEEEQKELETNIATYEVMIHSYKNKTIHSLILAVLSVILFFTIPSVFSYVLPIISILLFTYAYKSFKNFDFCTEVLYSIKKSDFEFFA